MSQENIDLQEYYVGTNDILKYGETTRGETYSIYKTGIPKSQITPDMVVTVDLGVSTIVVPTEKLPMLLPPQKIE